MSSCPGPLTLIGSGRVMRYIYTHGNIGVLSFLKNLFKGSYPFTGLFEGFLSFLKAFLGVPILFKRPFYRKSYGESGSHYLKAKKDPLKHSPSRDLSFLYASS